MELLDYLTQAALGAGAWGPIASKPPAMKRSSIPLLHHRVVWFDLHGAGQRIILVIPNPLYDHGQLNEGRVTQSVTIICAEAHTRKAPKKGSGDAKPQPNQRTNARVSASIAGLKNHRILECGLVDHHIDIDRECGLADHHIDRGRGPVPQHLFSAPGSRRFTV